MEATLFDRYGASKSYIDEETSFIYLWHGKVIAYIDDEKVYGWKEGIHLGRFIDGILYDLKGTRVGFLSDKCPVTPHSEPSKPTIIKPYLLKEEVITMSYNWGPHFIVPSDTLHSFSGTVVLRESFDNELLEKELEELGYSGAPYSASNPWYFRKRGQETWIKIGESTDRENNFAVQWNTTKLKNGEYEIFGLMHVTLRDSGNEFVICRQNSAKVQVAN